GPHAVRSGFPTPLKNEIRVLDRDETLQHDLDIRHAVSVDVALNDGVATQLEEMQLVRVTGEAVAAVIAGQMEYSDGRKIDEIAIRLAEIGDGIVSRPHR